MQKLVGACHRNSVVFDVFVTQNEDNTFNTRLLEINPFDSLLTDPCMFKWDELKNLDGGFFRFRNL